MQENSVNEKDPIQQFADENGMDYMDCFDCDNML